MKMTILLTRGEHWGWQAKQLMARMLSSLQAKSKTHETKTTTWVEFPQIKIQLWSMRKKTLSTNTQVLEKELDMFDENAPL